MTVLGRTWDWFLTGSHWRGTNGVPHEVLLHVEICALALGVACAVSLPLALALGHWRRGGFLAINISGIGRAVPTYAMLIVFAAWPLVGFGNRSAVVAMTLFAIPPIITNTYVGVRDVDEDVREAARGMGMSGWQVLRRVELPLSLPLTMAGIRTATVQVIATATLAAYVGGDGLGTYIYTGFSTQDTTQVLAGAILVALLALVAELGLSAVQRRVTPAHQARRRALPAPADLAVAGPAAAG